MGVGASTLSPADGLPPIGAYGLIGDTRTAALVTADGAIDWLCVPGLDGDPLFGRLVGGPEAGTFRLGPAGRSRSTRRRYHPASATLETTWDTTTGRLILAEGMVAEITGRLLPTTVLVRRLSGQDGPVQAAIELDPRLGERRRPPKAQRRGDALVCQWGSTAVAIQTTPRMPLEPGRPLRVTVTRTGRSPSCSPWPAASRWSTSIPTRRGPSWSTTSAAGKPGAARSTTTCPSGTRWCAASSRCGCSPTRPPGRRSPRRPHRCPNSPAVSATGTTATPGPATPASASAPSWAWARPTRPACSWPGCCTPPGSTGPACRSC